MKGQRQLRRAAAAFGLVVLGTLLLTGCTDTSDQSMVKWEKVDSRKIVALDSTQSIFVSGGRYSVDGESRVDYRFAQKTKDGAIRENLVSTLMDRTMYYDTEKYVVDIYEDAEPKSAKLSVYKCQENLEHTREVGKNPFVNYKCATEDGEALDYLVRIHVPKGTVDRSFGSETRSDSEEGTGDGSSSR